MYQCTPLIVINNADRAKISQNLTIDERSTDPNQQKNKSVPIFEDVDHTYCFLEIAWYPCYRLSMIASFRDKATEDIFNGISSRIARKACSQAILRVATRKLDQLDSVESLDELKVPPGNRLEMLSGSRKGQYSIRINNQFRLCFLWGESGPENVEITDYH